MPYLLISWLLNPAFPSWMYAWIPCSIQVGSGAQASVYGVGSMCPSSCSWNWASAWFLLDSFFFFFLLAWKIHWIFGKAVDSCASLQPTWSRSCFQRPWEEHQKSQFSLTSAPGFYCCVFGELLTRGCIQTSVWWPTIKPILHVLTQSISNLLIPLDSTTSLQN